MAELIVHNPPRAALKASGYIGSPEGDIELTENDKTYNVSSFASATVKIPEEEKTVTPSAVKQEITPDNGLLSKVTVLPAPLEERTVTPTIVQQTITPEAPAIGLSKVTVGAALPPPILVSKQIIENRTYTAADDNADGYSEVTVDVPDESKAVLDSLIDRTITTITSDATSIGSNAFSNCASLTKANFPNVTSIGRNAFQQCTTLTEANFPNATSISSNAFNSCASLTEVSFPKVTSIGSNTFQNCTTLTEVSFPNVTSITSFAFSNCSSLTEASFPETTSIDAYAFYSCASLTEVSFPKVTSIGSNAFRNCSRLQYFDMSEVDKPPIITTDTFYGTTCIFLFRDQTQLDEYASATNWSALADRFQIKGVTS